MARLSYVGATPSDPNDVLNRLQGHTILVSGSVNRTGVDSAINDAVATRASKSYVDTQDATFQLPTYYQNQDALNIAVSSVGQPNGVAFLDGGTATVPLAQMPPLGAGYVKGPYGPTHVQGATATTTPLKIADFDIGAQGITFFPLVFATVLATSTNLGRPVIEARISDGQKTYANQALVARGMGRNLHADQQPVVVTSFGGTGSFGPDVAIWLSLWLTDLTQTSVVSSGGIISAVVFLLRTQL